MNQFLVSLYEQNEAYHTVKEKMAWQGLSIYAAFSLVVMKWFHGSISTWNDFPRWIVWAFLAGLFWCAFWFVTKQVYLKAISVLVSEKYRELMYEYPEPAPDRFTQILHRIGHAERLLCRRQRFRVFRKNGWPGIWAIFAIALLFAAQIVFLCLIDP